MNHFTLVIQEQAQVTFVVCSFGVYECDLGTCQCSHLLTVKAIR
jgi:hypothetical protein